MLGVARNHGEVARPRTVGDSSERGAVLALIAIFMLIFLVVATMAVDLSALERRGQTLQNTADAAALAAVATWQETGSLALTQARVDDILEQNGVTGDDIEVQVIPDGNEVRVILHDTEPDVFLGAAIGYGDEDPLSRDATARLDICENSCDREVTLNTPFPPTSVKGTGDGYYPVMVRNGATERLYAVNHDDDGIDCVDLGTKQPCWVGDRRAAPFDDTITGSVTHTAGVGKELFWVSQEATRLTLFCWDTTTDTPCEHTPIADLRRAGLAEMQEKYLVRGGGVVAVGNRVFVFTDDHRVHCVDTVTHQACQGYIGGLETGLGSKLGFLPLDPAFGTTGSNIDRVIDETDHKIYHTLHINSTAASEGRWSTGIWLDCWDAQNAQPCHGFSPVKIHDLASEPGGQARQAGRLFLHRTTAGQPNGVCSTGRGDVVCVDFTGTRQSGLEAGMARLEVELPDAGQYTNGMGIHTYDWGSNRVFLSGPRNVSETHCWDFKNAEYCGNIYGDQLGIKTGDYGFVVEGECLYGVGHGSVFWAFTIDMTPGCPGSTQSIRVDKCLCGAASSWGEVRFNYDVGPTSPFQVLNVRVFDDDSNLLDSFQLAGAEEPIIPLAAIPTTHDYLILEIYVETDGSNPWAAPERPAFIFEYPETPFLTE